MLVRYLKAQAMVLLCGGLVGPIFLAVYFFSGQDELMKWMFWTGLLVTAIDVLVALALAGFGEMRSAERDALEAGGVLALRAHRLTDPITVPFREEYGGCTSWVALAELPDDPASLPSEPARPRTRCSASSTRPSGDARRRT